MTAKNFDLFMGCVGNGTTVCNRAVTEHGNIELYVPADYIPSEAMRKIQNVANADKQNFMKMWNKKDYMQKWEYMMELPTIGCGYNAVQLIDRENKHLPMCERVELMEKVFFEMHM